MNDNSKTREYDIPDFMKTIHMASEESDSGKAKKTKKRKKKKASAHDTRRRTQKTNQKRTGAQKSEAPTTAAQADTETQTRKPSGKKRPSSRRKKKKARQMKSMYLHIAFTSLILLIAIVAIVKLIRWNRGKESEYDPNEVTTEFDTEPEDYFVPLDSSAAALQKDDGITTTLLLGNGSVAKTKGEENGVGMRLEALTGGKVYDASLDHTYLSVKNTVYDDAYPADVFSLYWMAYCITSGDFTLLEDTARVWDGDDTAQETVEMLKSLDMSAVDTVVIMYDSHDYEDKRILAGPYDDTLPATCCGCLLQSILLFQQAFPHIRIIVSSPYFCYIEDEDGQLQPGSTLNFGEGTLADYMIAYKNIAVNANVSFVDNYFGTITADNYEPYLEDDKEHLNDAGAEAIAGRIASFIGAST